VSAPEDLGLQLAQAAPADGGGGGAFGFFLPLAAMFLLLYALVIRPQQRQQKEHRQMLAEIERGDFIVTSGGLHGRVVGIADDVLTVEVAERVRVKVDKSAVGRRRSATPAKEKEKPKEKKG
jgi:preprotein translocase subunit YajC